MPEKIKTEDGKMVESYSKAELDAQSKEAADKAASEAADAAIAKYKEENPDKSEDFEAQLKEKEEEIAKLKDKEKNFAKIRTREKYAEENTTEKLEKEFEEREERMEAQLEEKFGVRLKESSEATEKKVLEGVYKDHYSEELKALAGEDDELKKQIEFHYGRLNDPTTNKAEISKKLRDAWILATPTEQPNAMNTAVISSGGASASTAPKSESKFSEEEKALAQKLASAGGFKLSDEDFNRKVNILGK